MRFRANERCAAPRSAHEGRLRIQKSLRDPAPESEVSTSANGSSQAMLDGVYNRLVASDRNQSHDEPSCYPAGYTVCTYVKRMLDGSVGSAA